MCPLNSLEPELLWSNFAAICGIPHPSKHEDQISEHVQNWARERDLEVACDEAGSIVVRVPATPGHEEAATVILQGHLDMVGEKNSDCEHNFETDPIKVVVEDDWVSADGTTLGADNGVGVAAAMAIVDDVEAVHGPLEILCTVDEETGLTGAKQLDADMLSGRIMINLDTEEDGAIYFGCAGGADTNGELGFSRRRALLGTLPVRLAVRGLRGGHSGLNIIENRGNAVKLATRTLLAVIEGGIELDLVSFAGGSKHNAIPREAFAVCRVDKGCLAKLEGILEQCAADFREEYLASDPEVEVVLEKLDDADEYIEVLNVHARDRLLHLLSAMPHGVLSMSRDVPGLVETSNNLAVVKVEDTRAWVNTSHRSSVMPALFAVREQVRSVCDLAGANVTVDDAYPGWKPNPDSPIVKKTAEVHQRLFASEPAIKAIHAGLECGLLIEKLPGLDAVSIGPEIRNAHSPEEMVQISSVQRFYKLLKALLEDLA